MGYALTGSHAIYRNLARAYERTARLCTSAPLGGLYFNRRGLEPDRQPSRPDGIQGAHDARRAPLPARKKPRKRGSFSEVTRKIFANGFPPPRERPSHGIYLFTRGSAARKVGGRRGSARGRRGEKTKRARVRLGGKARGGKRAPVVVRIVQGGGSCHGILCRSEGQHPECCHRSERCMVVSKNAKTPKNQPFVGLSVLFSGSMYVPEKLNRFYRHVSGRSGRHRGRSPAPRSCYWSGLPLCCEGLRGSTRQPERTACCPELVLELSAHGRDVPRLERTACRSEQQRTDCLYSVPLPVAEQCDAEGEAPPTVLAMVRTSSC